MGDGGVMSARKEHTCRVIPQSRTAFVPDSTSPSVIYSQKNKYWYVRNTMHVQYNISMSITHTIFGCHFHVPTFAMPTMWSCD